MNLVVEKAAPACRLIRSEIVLRRACPVCRASDKDSATETAVSDYSLTVGEERERIVRQEMIDQSAGERPERGRREAEEKRERDRREARENLGRSSEEIGILAVF